MVERRLAKAEVAGPSPVFRSNKNEQTNTVCSFFDRLPGEATRAGWSGNGRRRGDRLPKGSGSVLKKQIDRAEFSDIIS